MVDADFDNCFGTIAREPLMREVEQRISDGAVVGLMRGFLSAGAPTLLLSLWTVDDETTPELMASFYRHLLAGESPVKALRTAQLQLMEKQPHQFFWSPFMIAGRPE